MPRRNTRELILNTSLLLFNQHGEPNVSTNHIADEADISPGNLYYHFRSKDDISLELFKLFLVQIQPLMERHDDEPPGAEALWLRFHLIFEVMGRFRFLYRNLADLQARITNLRRAFHGLLARQRKTLIALFRELEQQEKMNISDQEIDTLADNMSLFMTFWIPFAEIQSDPGLEDGSVLNMAVARCLHMVAPYFREPERSKLRALADMYH